MTNSALTSSGKIDGNYHHSHVLFVHIQNINWIVNIYLIINGIFHIIRILWLHLQVDTHDYQYLYLNFTFTSTGKIGNYHQSNVCLSTSKRATKLWTSIFLLMPSFMLRTKMPAIPSWILITINGSNEETVATIKTSGGRLAFLGW